MKIIPTYIEVKLTFFIWYTIYLLFAILKFCKTGINHIKCFIHLNSSVSIYEKNIKFFINDGFTQTTKKNIMTEIHDRLRYFAWRNKLSQSYYLLQVNNNKLKA